ncbi:hypothetical protein BaRGS_00024372 [Batillaria attramentaria]|uniref:Uncharacterized protein n=1 Tax=Batillaria attramentaria TaxID=370345 RepID=A0ABD0JIZ7_9CAEN
MPQIDPTLTPDLTEQQDQVDSYRSTGNVKHVRYKPSQIITNNENGQPLEHRDATLSSLTKPIRISVLHKCSTNVKFSTGKGSDSERGLHHKR